MEDADYNLYTIARSNTINVTDWLGCFWKQHQPNIEPYVKKIISNENTCKFCNKVLQEIDIYLHHYKNAQDKQKSSNVICNLNLSCGNPQIGRGAHKSSTNYINRVMIRESFISIECDSSCIKTSRRFHHEIIHAEDFCLKGLPADCNESIKREIDAYYFSACYTYRNPKKCLSEYVIKSMPAYPKCEGVNLKDKVKVSIDQFMLNKKRG